MSSLTPEAFFDLSRFAHREVFSGISRVWEALERIRSYLEEVLEGNPRQWPIAYKQPLPETVVIHGDRCLGEGLQIVGGNVKKGQHRVLFRSEELPDAVVLHAGCVLWGPDISFGPGTVVEPGALVKGPTLVGACTEIRQGAYLRGGCIVGDRCVVGHATEMKNSILLDGAQAGHFAYIGDSVLGNDVNLGAGTKLANLKMKRASVRLRIEGEPVDTGMRKLGAILGDGTETGCNSVTNPGALLGKGCLVFPNTAVAPGCYEPRTVIGSLAR